MPNAIRTDSENNRTTGFAIPGLFDGKAGSVRQQVHDGDTIAVRPNGNLGVRLLGIDTPEVSYLFPEPGGRFISLSDSRWNDLLTSPFDSRWGEFTDPVSERLKQWIAGRTTGVPGTLHYQHAVAATEAFEALVEYDMKVMGQTVESFGYYLNFGFEVMDGYGRLLCHINRNQPHPTQPTRRPPSYNLRLLERGRAFPYFIWPNINPWNRPDSVTAAVIPAGKAAEMAESDRELQTARAAVQAARERHLGLFDAMEPMLLEPFELRFLSRRQLPSRYLIDLRSDSNVLIHPGNYPTVPHPEDRLWIPPAYVPLFEKSGWEVEDAPEV
jgi:endonuclease YncB( thermonuclease family)